MSETNFQLGQIRQILERIEEKLDIPPEANVGFLLNNLEELEDRMIVLERMFEVQDKAIRRLNKQVFAAECYFKDNLVPHSKVWEENDE